MVLILAKADGKSKSFYLYELFGSSSFDETKFNEFSEFFNTGSLKIKNLYL